MKKNSSRNMMMIRLFVKEELRLMLEKWAVILLELALMSLNIQLQGKNH